MLDSACPVVRECGGSALVEVLIAAVVLAVTVLAVIDGQLSSFASSQSSQESTVALGELQSAAESVLGLQVDDIPVAGSEFEAGQPVTRFTDRLLRDEQVVATYPGYTPGGVVPNPLTIVLTIEWSDSNNRSQRMSLRTAKVR